MKRSVDLFLRVLPTVALLSCLATEASANHLHYIPIEDPRYKPDTLSDFFSDDPLERWIISTGTPTFSTIDDANDTYSVADGIGNVEVTFDFPFFEDVDPTATAFFRFQVNSLPGSGDSQVPQTIEVGWQDLSTQIKWDEAQGTISGTKAGLGGFTVTNTPAWDQGQSLPWEVTMYYHLDDWIATFTINGLEHHWIATGGGVNPFSNFFPFPGTDPDHLDIYAYVKCEDECEVQALDWGLLTCDTNSNGELDVGSCVGLRVVGNGIVDPGETCDDGNTLPGDGCDENGQLEKIGRKCQGAIGKAGRKYVNGRLKLLQKCRNRLNKGAALFQDKAKTVAITERSECPNEHKTAAKLAKARKVVRKLIAAKCTDALVGALATCGETVDELVSPDATAGCLIETHDAGVAALLAAQYGG